MSGLGIFLWIIGICIKQIIIQLIGITLLYIGIRFTKYTQRLFISLHRKTSWMKLSEEELQMVEDAKNLIMCIDQNIEFAKFNVYKVKFIITPFFDYDNSNNELCIFIPFDELLRLNKDLCFSCVLHEILHSQNLKNNIEIFNENFLEGLNELLTQWLIEKYSLKYKLPVILTIDLSKLYKKSSRVLELSFDSYVKEVNMVKEVFKEFNGDYTEIFLNYINLNEEYFRSIVPEKYFKLRS